MKKKIAIFASGNGTNCENIIQHFRDDRSADVAVVVSNRKDAFVLQRAMSHGIPSVIISKQQLEEEQDFVLKTVAGCDYIILAGFLLRIPDYLTERFPRKIINIHPSLLPKFGGKGMWGRHVHEAVKEAGETETGITVHYVTPEIDKGSHIAQFRVMLQEDDSVEDIEKKVRILEKEHFPKVISRLMKEADMTEYERYCREQALQQEEEFDEERCFPEMPEGQFVRGH
ncbi:MAG: phosphoribosylglycinamide formyltransferase [Clostridium sp.]|nr:phosphoribosylglycinamide formyltransferase [Clostridium sp.]